MRKGVLKLATIVSAALASLVFTQDAFAVQTLLVSQASSVLTMTIAQSDADPQPAKIEVYVPSGYVLNTALTPGTNIGTASGNVTTRDEANIDVPLSGDVVVDAPEKYADNACSPGMNTMVLVMQLTVAGQPYDVPIFVSPSSAEGATPGTTKLVVCLEPVDTPLGSPNHSPLGAHLGDLTLTLTNVFTPPSTATRWISLWTPFAARTGVADPDKRVEARAFAGPGKITLAARVRSKVKRWVAFTGRVTFAGLGVGMGPCSPPTDASCPLGVILLLNGTPRFRLETAADGRYGVVLKKDKNRRRYPVTTSFFQARITVPTRDITATACTDPTVLNVPCVSATASAFTATSQKIKVRI